jgi:hypothetical protein
MTFGGPEADRQPDSGAPGPVEAAKGWLESILTRVDIRAAWQITDPDYRLALTQAIIYLNDEHPLLVGHDKDELAAALAGDRPDHPLWDPFANLLTEEFLNDLGEIRSENWMTAIARPIAPGYELVLFPRERSEANDPPEMHAHGVLVHWRDGRWYVAGLSERRAVPGWPPDLGY